MKHRWILGAAAVVALPIACSLVNAPDDPQKPPGPTGGQAAAGTGGQGGSAGQGGAGGGPDCGDGVPEDPEECDDGRETATCDSDCTHVECGDGTLNLTAGEQCDDGDLEPGDACSPQCEVTIFDVDPQSQSDPAPGTFHLRPSVGLMQLSGEDFFVVAWIHEEGAGPPQDRIDLRLYTLTGIPVDDGPTQLSTETTAAWGTVMASNHLSRSVVLWDMMLPSAPNQLRYRVISPGGAPVGCCEVMLPETDVPRQGAPEIAAAASGEFCIVYLTEGNEVRARCLDHEARDLGQTHVIGQGDASSSGDIWGTVGIWAFGDGFMASFYDLGGTRLLGQRLRANGERVGEPIELASFAAGTAVYIGGGFAGGPAGGFMSSHALEDVFGGPEARTRLLFRPFDQYAQPIMAPSLASQDVDFWEYAGRLVGHANGRFAAVWSAVHDFADEGCSTRMRRFRPTGGALDDGVVLVPFESNKCSFYVHGKSNAAGDVMLVWTRWSRSGDEDPPAKTQAVIYPRLLVDQ